MAILRPHSYYWQQKAIAAANVGEDEIIGRNFSSSEFFVAFVNCTSILETMYVCPLYTYFKNEKIHQYFRYYPAYLATTNIAVDNAAKLEIIGGKFLPL